MLTKIASLTTHTIKLKLSAQISYLQGFIHLHQGNKFDVTFVQGVVQYSGRDAVAELIRKPPFLNESRRIGELLAYIYGKLNSEFGLLALENEWPMGLARLSIKDSFIGNTVKCIIVAKESHRPRRDLSTTTTPFTNKKFSN